MYWDKSGIITLAKLVKVPQDNLERLAKALGIPIDCDRGELECRVDDACNAPKQKSQEQKDSYEKMWESFPID